MEILQLKYFFDSAKNGSFAKTAEKYMVPQTSVSASVKRLEKELGCELFSRTSNRILLNENGKRLLTSLDKIFDELNYAVDSLSNKTSDTREIKMLVRAMRSTITDHIIEYKTKHPHISFKTVFDFDDLDFEKYDIIIDEQNNDYESFEKIILYNTKVRLRIASTHPLAHKKLTLKQLSNQPFVSIGENNGMHKILINACKKAGFIPNIVVLSNDIWCNRKFVEAGVGIGLAREYPFPVKNENIKILDVSDFNEKQVICGYYKKNSAYGNVEHFLNFLKNKAIT